MKSTPTKRSGGRAAAGRRQKPHKVKARRDLTIYEAGELKEELVGALADRVIVELDLSGVAEIDTAGIQLLLLAQREVHGRGGRLRMVSPSAPVQALLDLFNLAAHFSEIPAPGANEVSRD